MFALFAPSRVEKALASEIEFLRRKLEQEQERCNRLIEALAEVSNVKIVMPQATREERTLAVASFAREKSSGYFDTIKPAPPKENNGGK